MQRATGFWVLLSDKAGDNAQVLNLAQATGLSFETKNLVVLPQFALAKPRVTPGVDHLDLNKSDPLTAPWPRIVLAVGRRPSRAALWIKQQSGGTARIVLIGAPKGCHRNFDLVIAPAHYRHVKGARVLRIGLPLLAVPHAKLENERLRWEPEFSSLPRPLNALLIGGSTGAAEMKSKQATEITRKTVETYPGGTIFAVTSRRTPQAAALAVQRSLPRGSRFYRWSPAGGETNPYFGLLACADRFIVTGDSISMTVEAAITGKPVAIAQWKPHGLRAHLERLWQWFTGPPSRDFDMLHEYLFRTGLAVRLGDTFNLPARPVSDLEHAAEHVRKLAACG
jgi:uncharacterized protein